MDVKMFEFFIPTDVGAQVSADSVKNAHVK